ncbi:fumarylacetoacetate hydrolase family protein [Hoeflea sp. TYP-13]|uniref:fumarylacetoacetate hydrolase family protein n=1 Tax=Hoeflea sp. TYP-13 TaxID=3230023 RepID=UPI0034C67CE6
MKLRRVRTNDGSGIEALHFKNWVCLCDVARLNDLAGDFSVEGDLARDMIAVLQLGKEGWAALETEIANVGDTAPEDKEVLLPFAPASFRDFMLYEDHVINATRGYLKKFVPGTYRFATIVEKITGKPFKKFRPHPLWYRRPIYYFGNHMNFLTDGDPIRWPAYTDALDYELELGAVLAHPLDNATPEAAELAIGGFVVLNDVSARDMQRDEMASGFGPQKAKHFTNAMSSIVATADEILPEINNLEGSVSINGETVADCSSAHMRYSMGEVLAAASMGEQLHPGELFGTGTLPGGSGMENGHWLEPGDRLELRINRIGTLSNTIAQKDPE